MTRRIHSTRAAAGLLAAAIALVGTGCTVARPAHFAATAQALGASVDGEGCAHGQGTLTEQTLETWQANPHKNPYAADFSCLALEDNLTRDGMNECTPAPADVFSTPLQVPRRITGELFYLGIDPREYSYDLLPTEDGGTEVNVRIQFVGSLTHDAATMAALRTKLAIAAAFWTRHSPVPTLRFRFEAKTDDRESPHFTINLDPGASRTPYDTTWGSEWTWHLIAHEIGHLMGLDDEYEQIRKTIGHIFGIDRAWDLDRATKLAWFKCDLESLMCDSRAPGSTPQRYNYYVILRRRFCRSKPQEYPRF